MNHLESVTSKRSQWYWYLLVFFLCIVIANTVGSIPLLAIMIISFMKNGIDMGSLSGMSFDFSDVDKNLVLFAMLFVFAVMLIAAAVFIKLIHGRLWTEVINGTKHVRRSRFFFGFLVFGVITVVLLSISYFIEPENLELRFEPVKFLILLMTSVIFIPLQATAEEFLFRGYLAQGVASWTHSRWWALIIPSVLFGLLHSYNPEVAEYGFGVMMTQYIFMGFMLGLMSILDDGIELAMGVHTVNNLLGSVLVTYKGSALQTYALFEIKEFNPVEDIIPTIISGIIALSIFAVKYRWNFKVLNRKVILTKA
ncbi:MAG: CPBP family intramembrane metalloprotease [Tannerella sp.]|jgi:membrane protease YdiL (CAAX protease family)|nr:CPBP family intramembrane metalloprotease [Tannerella sp.]